MATRQVERRKRGVFGWIFLTLFWIFNAFMLTSCVVGMQGATDGYDALSTDAERAGAAIGTTLGVAMLGGIWSAGAIVLGLAAFFTRGPKIIETLEEGEAAPKKKGVPLWAWIAGSIVGIFVLAGVLGGGSKPSSSSTAETGATEQEAVSAEPTEAKAATPKSPWTYTSDEDKMRGQVDKFAQVSSTNTVNFGFPYEDGQMMITLRKSAKYGKDIVIHMREGQFVCRYDGCTISAKFDDGAVQSFSVNEASGGGADSLFIVNQSRFLTALRAAKRVTIEAEFYDHGREQFEFEVQGLEWE